VAVAPASEETVAAAADNEVEVDQFELLAPAADAQSPETAADEHDDLSEGFEKLFG
jgi:hypothetical protein